jgi:ketosteroid isomerase-like protein
VVLSLWASVEVAAQTSRAAREIAAVRRQVREAIAGNAEKRLARLFADDFTHPHASGRVDDKAARLKGLLAAGEATIDSVAETALRVRLYAGGRVAVALGGSRLPMAGSMEFSEIRWTVVYVRQRGRWQAAASHASRLEKQAFPLNGALRAVRLVV